MRAWMRKKLFSDGLVFVWLMCAGIVSMAAAQQTENELAASIRAKLEAGQFDSAVSESRSGVKRYPASGERKAHRQRCEDNHSIDSD
jgi:hypothetical protein